MLDLLADPTAHAGITCTVCHAITHVNSQVGNASYTIEEPLHYPFMYSDSDFLLVIDTLGEVGARRVLYDNAAEFYRSAELNAMARQLQPHILINNRSGLPEDFGTPEQLIASVDKGLYCKSMGGGSVGNHAGGPEIVVLARQLMAV